MSQSSLVCIAPWLFTYSLHALLAAAAALFAQRWLPLTAGARSHAWKWALFVPLGTALLATTRRMPEALLPPSPHTFLMAPLALELRAVSGRAAWHAQLLTGLCATALLLSALGLLRFSAAAFALWRRLRSRVPARDTALLAAVRRLEARTNLPKLRLTVSHQIYSPLVLGANEICLPHGWLSRLDARQLDAALAHEAAHLERRDGLWFPLVGVVEAALCAHPLTRWVAARFRENAELACDDRAVAITGDATGLARALTSVAASALEASALLPAMTATASPLMRVRRLLHGNVRAAAAPLSMSQYGVALTLAFATLLACWRLSIQIAQPAVHEARRTPSAPAALLAAGERIAQLMQREAELELQLGAQRARAAETSDAHEQYLVLELEQSLRHVRADAAWIENRATSTTQEEK